MIARGWAGPSLLAMVLFEKFGQHQPLNRQAERYATEGVPISLSIQRLDELLPWNWRHRNKHVHQAA